MSTIHDMNLADLLGKSITERLPFQWVKLIGRNNIVSNVEKGERIVVDRTYIVRLFEESQQMGRTSEAFANLLLSFYRTWISTEKAARCSGLIAEEIHRQAMNRIANYWKVSWKPREHSNPANGIMNGFEMIRNSVQYKFLSVQEKGKKGYRYDSAKMKAQREFRESTDPLTEFTTLATNPTLDWDCYHILTPEQVYMLQLLGIYEDKTAATPV